MKRDRHITPKRLVDLWENYSAFRKGQISPSTYKRDYAKIANRIAKMRSAAPYLETSIEIRDWLLTHYASETARRTLVQFNACCQWAMESDIIRTNPFRGLPRHIRQKKSELVFAAFSIQERDIIIQEFDVSYPFYAPWVKFLFWTGCRPEEAAALRWQHISKACDELLFIEAFPVDMNEPQATKNRQSTRFPCNSRLQRLLRSRMVEPVEPQQFVFQGVLGGRFNYHNFQTRYWRPLVTSLAEEGRISFYLSQYHCRHTWITEALNHLSVADVSYLARVSTTVLYKHYAGRSRRILIPEF